MSNQKLEMHRNVKHVIDKSFSFCYGHRVHNQRLNTVFTESGNACLACRHLHGHEGLVKIFIEAISDNVSDTGMVTDFKHLGWFKNFIDDTLDHKFIMDLQDPLFNDEFELMNKDTMVEMENGYYLPNMRPIIKWLDDPLRNDWTSERKQAFLEKYEGAVFVDFVPTSENLASWMLSIAQDKMKSLPGIKVLAVEYNETPKSHCRVEAI